MAAKKNTPRTVKRATNAHARKPVEEIKDKTVLVLSAGAPNAPLAAGALDSLLEASIDFPRIYASGGGVILALIYVAPRGIGQAKTPNETIALRRRALASLPDVLGIDDRIYKRLPLGYKAFVKHSPWNGVLRELFKNFKIDSLDPKEAEKHPTLNRIKERLNKTFPENRRRLHNDLVDLATVILTPSFFMPRSKRMRELFPWTSAFDDLIDWNAQTGLCEPLPWLDDLVDWDYLNKTWEGDLFIPAYHLTTETSTRDTRVFCNFRARERLKNTKSDQASQLGIITADTVRASLSAPFIYPPKYLAGDEYNPKDDDDPYIEGAYEDPYNEEIWLNKLRTSIGKTDEILNVFVIDLLSTREMQMALLRKPESLWEAYGQSILTPIVAQSKTTRYKIGEQIKQTNNWIRLREAVGPNIGLSRELLKRFEVPTSSESKKVNLMPPLLFGIEEMSLEDRKRLMDWNYGNLSKLFARGKEAGKAYLKKNLSEFEATRDLAPRSDSGEAILKFVLDRLTGKKDAKPPKNLPSARRLQQLERDVKDRLAMMNEDIFLRTPPTDAGAGAGQQQRKFKDLFPQV